MPANDPAKRAAVILAAGQGTRMKSPTPKVLHKVGGRTLLDHAIDAAQALGCEPIVVVCGTHSPAVSEHVAKRLSKAAVAIQDPPLGTGHAVLATRKALAGFEGDVVVTFADCPLMSAEAIAPLFAVRGMGTDVAVLGFEARDPGAYGRLVISPKGELLRIVEAKDADEAVRQVRHCNSGVLAADADLLFSLLDAVTPNNAAGEYYLTDVIGIAHSRGLHAKVAFAPEEAVQGVNSQVELAAAEAVFQKRRRHAAMIGGVSMTAPETVFLSWDTKIAAGVVVEPNVVFGEGVVIEGGAVIRAFSHLEGAVVRARALVGPYARLRPGSDIGEDAHIGNFVEVKKVTVGAGAKANHLSYLGDGTVGARANLGAGTIFCNYDGFDKFETHVGEGAFIGSNTSLVAPVRIGDGAYIGSGSVITEDVDTDALALERSRKAEKPLWASQFKIRKQSEKLNKLERKAIDGSLEDLADLAIFVSRSENGNVQGRDSAGVLRKAYEAGSQRAGVHLALLYPEVSGLGRSERQLLLEAGASAGSRDAVLILAKDYSTEVDPRNFVIWLARAIFSGSGEVFDYVLRKVDQFKDAIPEGELGLAVELGIAVRGGTIGDISKDEGVEVLRRAAEAGSERASLELSLIELERSKAENVDKQIELIHRLVSNEGQASEVIREIDSTLRDGRTTGWMGLPRQILRQMSLAWNSIGPRR